VVRDTKLKVSLIANLSIKFISIVINFTLVPLLLTFLGVEKYGIWLTIYALVGWLTMFDLGLGNGLKLKLTEAFSKKKYREAKKLITTAYVLIGSISLVLILLFWTSKYFVHWELLLGLSKKQNLDISKAVSILAISFFIILIIKLISEIFSSLQLPFIDDLAKALSQFIFLGFLLFFINYSVDPSLSNVAILAITPLILIYFLLSVYFFIIKAPSLKISINYYSKDLANSILSPGVGFFVIQISSIILYSTDNLLIANLISPTAVTTYNIAYRFFGLPFMIFSLFIATHWVSFIDALTKGDEMWIKNKLRLFNYLFLLLVVAYVIAYFLYDVLVPLWIRNDKVKTDFLLNKAMIFYYLISSYATIYIYVVNASGKIAIQKYLYIIIAVINIPLSILFVKFFNLGSAGVIIASAICLLLLLVFIPIQSSKLINRTAKGIWNK
jgi:O-antigen/teichoic acid export membrane protein